MKSNGNGDARVPVTRLSEAEIRREAELIMRAIQLNPRSGNADILLPSRELHAEDEDRVVLALEEMHSADSA